MNLSKESKEILNNKLQLKKSLSQILPKDLIDYMIELIALNQAHQRFLELTKD